MAETVDRCNEVILRLGSGIAHDQCVEHLVVWISKEDWLENYVYDATYLFVFGDFSKEMTKSGIYKVPNEWILDGVNLSVESVREWNVLDASIDAGWTYCGKVDRDDTRFNKSVIRKQDANGKYVDTNNSTNDFTPEAPASLLNK